MPFAACMLTLLLRSGFGLVAELLALGRMMSVKRASLVGIGLATGAGVIDAKGGDG